MGRLRLDGPCAEWQPAAHRARYLLGGAWQPVVVVVGPEVELPVVDRAREDASGLLGVREDGVLPLVGIEPVEHRVAWIYEDVRGLGLGHTLDGGVAPMPLSVAAAIVARVAAVLARRPHPGPEPADVLLTADGRVWLTSFVGPFPRGPGVREPHGAEGPTASVYQLGYLLATLAGGAPLPGASDPVGHEGMVRRALIRAMARPGPGLSERYRDWIEGMLAWDPDRRPALSRVVHGLAELAAETLGPDLGAWAAQHVGPARAQLAAADDPWDVRPYRPWPQLERVEPPPEPLAVDGQTTLPGTIPVIAETDEPTAESRATGDRPRRVSIPPEQGTLPVAVGPPPQAMKTPPQLPRAFLDAPPPRRRAWPWPLVLATAALIVVAACLIAYLW